MRLASGIDYAEAAKVPIPFASPRLLWRMQAHTHRPKDASDLVFLREYFAHQGEQPPVD